ncbi:MAG: hypothetical protein HN742_09800 [Lentisphaerae bacterium]|jgi:hypothetical protein|nr:hypothetical protein [Lentisphaerota bacterium]MBT4823143.1 hypothetical protein [Lentisphaerota bacterium]MBT5610469.1 hypothetical protein [Lentisphaerota bacterium]MBT7061060.1 hypothetical protein [Lentisphaerota bacterium]MBT7842155.1 hypothetical protein [Lentisphaerota bacterium]
MTQQQITRFPVLCLACITTLATGLELGPSPWEVPVPFASRTIDGDLADWGLPQAALATIDPEKAGKDPTISLHLNDPANAFKGAADLSAHVAVTWDDQNLYIAGIVRDDDLRGIKPDTPHNVGPSGWACDSVMFRIHSFRQPLKTNSPFTPTPFMALRYEKPADGRGNLVNNAKGQLEKTTTYWKLPEGSILASRETTDGYHVEAAVPWASLAFRPQAGEPLFCGFLLADIDEGEKLNQLGRWFSGETKATATFRLVRRPEATGTLSLSSRRPESGRRWSVSWQIDARTADVTARALVVKGSDGGEQRFPINVSVPKGQTAKDVVVVDKVSLEIGPAEVRLVAAIGQESVPLCSEALEVAPGRPPAPLVSNPPGELHHHRPDRVAHSAYEDHRRGIVRHDFVTDRSGYERYLLTHVKAYVDAQMEGALKRKTPHISGYALKCVTLYRLTKDERYMNWARDAIELALDLQEKTLKADRLFGLTQVRYHAWLHDPDGGLAPPDAEERFQTLWARAASEYDKGWMFAEWGYHNRCYHRHYLLKIASHFARQLGKPVTAEAEKYMAFHDPILDAFGAATDNSSGYHWVGFRYPAYFAQAVDDLESLADNKGWVDALQRWRLYSSPSGALPNFGDTSGWGTGAGQAMAYYEMMGRVTRDGRFRWQAHRIAEYLYNHFWPRHDQYHGPRDFIAGGFCRAWLFSDDSVAPVPRKTKSAITFRTRCVSTTEAERTAQPGLCPTKMIEEQVPDKLVLSSGKDPSHLWGLVELIDKGGHCGRLPGHIAALTQHDAALLAGQGYYERSADFNNTLWIEDMDGIAADPRPMRTEVPRFVEDSALTYARIRAQRYNQMPVDYEREIVFVKNAFVLVKDRVTFRATMRVRFGPCWQTRDLGPQCGADWFNTYYEYIYFTGLGLGKGVHAYRNPAWDLLVRFAPREDCELSVSDRFGDNPYRPSPTQLRQSWTGIATPGQTFTFTSVLLPHGPAFDVRPYADWIEFLVDNDDTTLVRVRTEFDNVHHFQSTHWLLLQEQGAAVSAEGFAGDARLALVTRDRRDRVRPAVIIDGDNLILDGKDLSAKARRPEAKTVFEVSE